MSSPVIARSRFTGTLMSALASDVAIVTPATKQLRKMLAEM